MVGQNFVCWEWGWEASLSKCHINISAVQGSLVPFLVIKSWLPLNKHLVCPWRVLGNSQTRPDSLLTAAPKMTGVSAETRQVSCSPRSCLLSSSEMGLPAYLPANITPPTSFLDPGSWAGATSEQRDRWGTRSQSLSSFWPGI